MASLKALNTIRLSVTVLSIALAAGLLTLLIGMYRGIELQYHQLVDGAVGERITVIVTADSLNAGVDELNRLKPEGLDLLTSPFAGSYVDLNMATLQPAHLGIQQINNIPGIKGVAWSNYAQAFGVNGTINLPVQRVPSDFFTVQKLALTAGSFDSATDHVVIGAKLADYFFPQQSPIGQLLISDPNTPPPGAFPTVAKMHPGVATSGLGYSYSLTVTGVLAPVNPARNVFDRAFDTTIFLIDNSLPTNLASVVVEPEAGQQAAVINQLQTQLAQNLPAGWRVVVESEQASYQQAQMRDLQQLVNSNFLWIVAIALILMACTVGISSYLAIVLKRRSLGIQRSLGATKVRLFRSLIGVGLLIGGVGIASGLLLAWISQGFFARLSGIAPLLDGQTLAMSCLVMLAMVVGSFGLTSWYLLRAAPSAMLREQLVTTLAKHRWLVGGANVMLGIIALIMLLGLRSGLVARIDQILGGTGAKTISAVSWTSGLEPFKPAIYLTHEDYAAVKAEFPAWQVAWRRSPMYTVIEASANLADLQPISLACGRWLNAEEETKALQVIVLGYDRALEIAKERKLANICELKQWRNLPVVGVLAGLDSWPLMIAQGFSPRAVYAPLQSNINPTIDEPQSYFPKDMYLINGEILVQIPATTDLDQAAKRLEQFLAARHPEGVPNLILPAGITQELLAQRSQIYLLAGLMVSLCLLISGVGLMNLTFISILSRAREIGIRRAVGAPKQSILRQILTETIKICLGAALLGGVIGLLLARVLQTQLGWPPTMPWHLLGVAGVTALLIGATFGVLPAWWAANLPPTRAINVQ
ncbi:ABC transporter permease [Herpetosiphon sp. NSE202]|uniref:ABC transporter permease n=1 Tax=Herpetosiphon sp. NSE202 TaxID=3351349 RepID=UPI00362C718E